MDAGVVILSTHFGEDLLMNLLPEFYDFLSRSISAVMDPVGKNYNLQLQSRVDPHAGAGEAH